MHNIDITKLSDEESTAGNQQRENDVQVNMQSLEIENGENRVEKHDVEKTNFQKTKANILTFMNKNFLPIAFVFAVLFGSFVPWPGAAINHKATQYICVIGVFLYSGVYLRTSAIKEAFRAVVPMIWGTLSILCVTCVIGGQLTLLLRFDKSYTVFENSTISSNTYSSNSTNNHTIIQNGTKIGHIVLEEGLGPAEFKYGILIYVCMPCPISSGLVMVAQLGGNFALALLLTVAMNICAVFTVPFFLKWMLSTTTQIHFDIGSLLLMLGVTVLLPLAVGKLLRLVKKIKDFVAVPKTKCILRIVNISLLAAMFWMQISTTSLGGGLSGLTALNALFIIGWSLLIHIVLMLVNTIVSFIFRFKTDQKKCIIILASQKALTIALLINSLLQDELGDHGLIAIAMVFCHITIIIFDSFLIPIWLSLEKRRISRENDPLVETETT